MATVEKLGLDSFLVSGEFNQVEVLLSLDDVSGALYHVWSNDEKVGVFSNVDQALEFAEEVCDTDYFETDVEEFGDSMTDAEADANALANIGWGTDEDYGYYGD